MSSAKQIKSDHSLHYRYIINLLAELLLGGYNNPTDNNVSVDGCLSLCDKLAACPGFTPHLHPEIAWTGSSTPRP